MAISTKELTAAYDALSRAVNDVHACKLGESSELDAVERVGTNAGVLSDLVFGKLRKTVDPQFASMCRSLVGSSLEMARSRLSRIIAVAKAADAARMRKAAAKAAPEASC